MKRRQFLLNTSGLVGAGLSAAALAACSNQTVNGVTVVTINVAEVDAVGQATINAAKLIAPLVAGPAAAVATGLLTVASADLAAFDKAESGSLQLQFNAGSPPAALASVLGDGQKLLTGLTQALGSSVSAKVQTYMTALATFVDALEAAAGMMTSVGVAAVSASAPLMTKAKAKSVLGVK